MKDIKITPRTLSGFMELLPRDQMRFDAMAERIRESFALYGFTPLDTPVIESAEILLAKAGGETEKQIYRFMKGDTDLALRFDLTVPLAKYVAKNYAKLSFPFRRYQIGKVYRGERAQRGRYREFYQCDIDVIGDGELGIMNEAEIPSIIYNTFAALGLTGVTVHLNNRKVLNGLFEIYGVAVRAGAVMNILDKIAKIGENAVRDLLISEIKLDPFLADEMLMLVTRGFDMPGMLNQAAGQSGLFKQGIAELRAVTEHLAAFGVPEENYKIDLSIARGLDYYTGTVYETYIDRHPEIGSICSGGRYDDLAGYYTDKKLPGVGISIGLTRLFYVLDEQGYLNPDLPTSPADVIILPMTDDFTSAAALAASFRAAGLRTLLYTENKKFKAKMSYADKLGVPYAAILGEDEIAAGRVTVRDMRTGEQTTASPAMIIQGLREKVAAAKDVAPVKAT